MGSRFSATLCWISMDGTARPSFRLDVEQLKRPYVQNRRASVLKSVRTITRASLIDLFGEGGGGFPHYSKFHSFLKSTPCIVSTPTFTDCSASVSMTREALKKTSEDTQGRRNVFSFRAAKLLWCFSWAFHRGEEHRKVSSKRLESTGVARNHSRSQVKEQSM